MKNFAMVVGACVLGALMVAVSGCNTEREPGTGNRAVLKAGQQVSADMVGWVAVPNTQPHVAENKAGGYSYAELTANNVVPQSMDNWYAVPAPMFDKMTGIKVAAKPAPAALPRWVLKPEGKSVPKDMNGWVAVPPEQSKVQASKGGSEVAVLIGNSVVPKEMNGWVAVNPDTFAKLVEGVMMKGPGADVAKPHEAPKKK